MFEKGEWVICHFTNGMSEHLVRVEYFSELGLFYDAVLKQDLVENVHKSFIPMWRISMLRLDQEMTEKERTNVRF